MTDPDTTAAAEYITRHLRGLSLRGADPEVVALELLAGLRARGWRPTEARVLPAWKRPAGSGTEPTEDYRRIREETEARPHPLGWGKRDGAA